MHYRSLMHRRDLARRLGVDDGDSTATATLPRRNFVKLLGTAGFALALAPLGTPAGGANAAGSSTAPAAPGDFVRISPDGTVTIQINRLEFGQGSHTGLAQILAEELDADWSRVRAELAPAGEAYKDPVYHLQMTGGSTAIAHGFTPYRELGARARAMLVDAAAKRWKVSSNTLSTREGRVIASDGRTADYGELAETAMTLPVPTEVALRPPTRYRLVGQPLRRLDGEAKSTGAQRFGIDVQRPGMKTVLVARPPTFGGGVEHFDATATLKVRGVSQVMQVDLDRGASGIAVVADGYWPAKLGRDALQVRWRTSAAVADSGRLDAEFEALLQQPGLPARDGGPMRAIAPASTLRARYRFPFLAHAPMEPLNVVMEMSGSGEAARCDVWTGTQFQTIDQATVASVLGLAPTRVHIHTQFAGGGFGRRATPTADYMADAARVLKAWRALGREEPLKLVWSREDDVRGGYYRPLALHDVHVDLDAEGDILAWNHTIVSPSILKGTAFEQFLVKDGVDATAVEGVADTPYAVPLALSVHHPEVPVPVLWWRSVGHTHTAFVMETLMHRVARATQRDPVDLRRRLLAAHPRHLAALDLAVTESGYGTRSLPEGQAFGVAVHESFGSVVAYVTEVSMRDGRPYVHRITAGIHCNTAVNPSAVEAQVQGACLMGIGTTLPGAAITLKDGAVQQSNFHDYRVARITDMPPIAVHIVPSTEPPSGVGEPGLPPIAPAIANAVFDLTGKPVESLPFERA